MNKRKFDFSTELKKRYIGYIEYYAFLNNDDSRKKLKISINTHQLQNVLGRLDEVVKVLSDEEADIIEKSFVEEKTAQEICEELKVSKEVLVWIREQACNKMYAKIINIVKGYSDKSNVALNIEYNTYLAIKNRYGEPRNIDFLYEIESGEIFQYRNLNIESISESIKIFSSVNGMQIYARGKVYEDKALIDKLMLNGLIIKDRVFVDVDKSNEREIL